MKIGIFTDSYLPLPNGVATAVDRTAQALEKRGHEVVIVAPSVPGHVDNRTNVYRLSSVRFFQTGTRFALYVPNKKLLNVAKQHYDIIHAHNGGPVSFFAWNLARLKKVPYIFTYWTLLTAYVHYLGRGLGNVTFMQALTRIICNYCDYLIVPTKAIKNDLKLYGVTKPMHVHPTGIAIEDYKNLKKGFIRNKLHIARDKKIILYVGRLGKEKSIDFLIDAFAELHKMASNNILVLVGNGIGERALKEQVARLSLEKYVYFSGAFPPNDIPKIYADADLFVFASQTETQGVVILEALASGLPIVIVKDDVYEGFITHNKNGFVVKKEPKAFAMAIKTVLEDEKKYKRFSQAARATAKNYSIAKTAHYLEGVYKHLLNK